MAFSFKNLNFHYGKLKNNRGTIVLGHVVGGPHVIVTDRMGSGIAALMALVMTGKFCLGKNTSGWKF